MKIKKIGIIILLSVWTVSASGSDSGISANIGPSFMWFDYAEYDQSDTFLDGEEGILTGAVGNFRFNFNKNYFVSTDARFYIGIVDYDGHTQPGFVPIKSTTNTFIFDINSALGRRFTTAPAYIDLYAGLGYHFWRRQINPTFTSGGVPVAGLLEYYQWWYLMAGTKFIFNRSGNQEIGLDIRTTYMQNASIEVDFQGFGGYDNKKLDLGNRFGFYLAVPIKFKSSSSVDWIIEPYYEYIDIGRSNVGELTSNGTPTGVFVVEPRSETRNIGVNIRIVLGH